MQRMVEEEAYCVDVLTQLGSIVSASEKVALLLLKDHTEHCVRGAIEDGEGADEKLEELMGAIERFLRVQATDGRRRRMTDVRFEVEGMSCGHKAAVEGELGKLPAVERSNADFEMGIVEVSYDEGRIGTEELKGAIEEAGYEVKA